MPFGSPTDEVVQPATFGHPDDEVVAPAQGQTFGHPDDEVVAPPSTKGYTTGSQPLVNSGEGFHIAAADKPVQQLSPFEGLRNAVEQAGAAILNTPARVSRMVTGTPQRFVIDTQKNELRQEDVPLPFSPNKPIIPQGPFVNTDPINRLLNRTTEGLSTPGSVVTLPFAATKPIQAFYLTQTVPAVYEAARQALNPSNTPQQRTDSAIDAALNTWMTILLGRNVAKPLLAKDVPIYNAEFVNEPKALIPENAGGYPNVAPAPEGVSLLPGPGETGAGKLPPTLSSAGEPFTMPQLQSEPRFYGAADAAGMTPAHRLDLLRELNPLPLNPSRLLVQNTDIPYPEVNPAPVNVLPPTENPVAPPDFTTPREQLTQLGPRVIQQGPMVVPPARQLGPPIESPPNASPIRSNEGLPPQETQEERPAQILQGGSGEAVSRNLQRESPEGSGSNGTQLRTASTPQVSPFANVELAPEQTQRLLHATTLEQKNPLQLRVAAQAPTGEVIEGKPGQIHANLNFPEGSEMGFVTPEGKFLTREQAANQQRQARAAGVNPNGAELRAEEAGGKIEPPPAPKNVEDRGSIGGNLSTFGFVDPAMWKQAKRTFEEWVKGDKNEPRPPGYSPYFKATPEQRAADILGPGPSRPINDVEIGQGRQPGQPKPATYGLQNTAATLRNVVNKADKAILVNDAITDLMDNSKAKFNGPLMQHIMWPIDDNYQVEWQLKNKFLQPLQQIIKDEGLTSLQGERIGTAMIASQEGGRAKLLASGVTDASIRNITASLSEGEKRAIRAINKASDEMFPLIENVASKFGIKINKVDNYLSWQRDWKKYDAPPKEVNLPDLNRTLTTADVSQWLGDAFPRKGTKTADSFTKERTNQLSPIKVNAFEIFDRHVRDAMHYVAMAEHLRDVGEIVRDPRFAEKYGKMGQDLMLDHLNTVARQGRSGNSIPLLDALRKRASLGILGYRVASQIIHLVNTPLGMFRAGPINWIKGLQEAHTAEGQAWLKANGAETFERGGGEPGIVELAKGNERGITPNPIKRAGEAVVAHAFDVPRFIDQKIAQATLIGTYQKLLEQKGIDSSKWASMPVDKEALAQARVYARRAVASPLYKDTANVLSKGSVSKLFFQFQNTFMDQWSNIRHDLPEYLKHDPKAAAGLAVALVTMLAMESYIKINVKKAGQQAMGYKPKQEPDFTHKMGEEFLKRFPGVGQLMSIVAHQGSGIPVADLLREAISGGSDIISAGKEGDKKKMKLAEVREGTRAAEVAGIPGASQVGELVENRLRATDFPSHEQRIAKIVQDKFKTDKPTLQQRLEAEKILQKTKEPLSRAEDVSAGQANLKNAQNRGADVQKALPKDMQDFLDKIGKRIPGHDNRIKINGTELTFTSDELKRYNEILTEKYQKNIGVLQRQWANKVPNGVLKDNLFSHYTEMSKKQADIAMRAELQKRKP